MEQERSLKNETSPISGTHTLFLLILVKILNRAEGKLFSP